LNQKGTSDRSEGLESLSDKRTKRPGVETGPKATRIGWIREQGKPYKSSGSFGVGNRKAYNGLEGRGFWKKRMLTCNG